jgi:hypothetical protein
LSIEVDQAFLKVQKQKELFEKDTQLLMNFYNKPLRFEGDKKYMKMLKSITLAKDEVQPNRF